MSSVSSKYTDEVALGGAWREAEFQFGFQMNWNAVSSSAQGPPPRQHHHQHSLTRRFDGDFTFQTPTY